MSGRFKIVVERHSDGYVAYPLGLKGVVVGEGDTYQEALADVQSAIAFHIETFGEQVPDGTRTPLTMPKYAIRQVQQVRDRTVVVRLPQGFPTSHVEVIILPLRQPAAEPGAAEADDVPAGIRRFLTRDTSRFTAAQRRAYERVCAAIRQGRSPHEPRILGLFAGLIQVADDFDAPLPSRGLS